MRLVFTSFGCLFGKFQDYNHNILPTLNDALQQFYMLIGFGHSSHFLQGLNIVLNIIIFIILSNMHTQKEREKENPSWLVEMQHVCSIQAKSKLGTGILLHHIICFTFLGSYLRHTLL